MQTFAIQSLDVLSRSRDITRQDNDIVSLDDRLLQAYAQSAVGRGMEKDSILASLADRHTVTDPAKLFALQQRTSDYNLEVSLISTLTRKAVGAVESLLRS
ncbi:type III secretion system protein PrgJ [Serratia proteamaculans]|uniref:type III secretion system inner rod subunit SctI n=1 Tax=Serratia proteamaculans TaxID=28151 RepID=UPI001076A95A|nr:type III secretion system inner rod subunit SctI [Serratia proteamaculans]TFZ48662.1 type III secretion system protein PrgJ [Serratia proteamaculans]